MTTPTIKPPVAQQSLTPRPTPETDALVRPYIGSMDKPTIDDISRLLDKARAIERQRDEALAEVARLRGVLEIIADPKAKLPQDGRTTCRIYEDMAQEALDKKGGGA